LATWHSSGDLRARQGVDATSWEDAETLDSELLAIAAAAHDRSNGHGKQRTRTVRPEAGRGRGAVLQRVLVTADVVGFTAAFLFVQLVVSAFETQDLVISAMLLAGLVGWVLLAQLAGLYEHEEVGVARSAVDDFPRLVLLATFATWIGLLTLGIAGLAQPKLHVTAIYWFASVIFIASARALARAVLQRRAIREPVLVVGTGQVAQRIAAKLARPEYALEVKGFIDDDPLELPGDAAPYLGDTATLEQIVRAYRIERVIVAFSTLSTNVQVDLLRRCAELGIRVDVVPRMYEVLGSQTHFHDVGGIPLMSVKPACLSGSARLAKRSMDLALASLALVVLGPFMLFAAWRIKAGSPGPVFFRQERMGAGGKRFQIYKFRSMYVDAEERKRELDRLNMHDEGDPRMFKIPDDPRITPFGRFLRKWSLDELPQLLNVIRGEMSLVGPRPLILDEDQHILGHHRRRLGITPGVTGLWQVLGRSDLPFSEMITLDYLYVTNWSLWGDVKLIARTFPIVLAKRGAY
jgi:exopolysaccharide biosynthesis polyprenyl glycosylphosphotransferase